MTLAEYSSSETLRHDFEVCFLIARNRHSHYGIKWLYLLYETVTLPMGLNDPNHPKPHHHHTTTILRPFFRDHPGVPVSEENFWTSRCKERLTEADTLTIRLGATPSRLTSAHLHHPPFFAGQARCPSCHPTNSVKALKAS